MTSDKREAFEEASRSFPELDEPARRRAEQRTAAGQEPQAALAHESVVLNLVRAYNYTPGRRD